MWTQGYFGLYVYNMSFCQGNHKLERGVLKILMERKSSNFIANPIRQIFCML